MQFLENVLGYLKNKYNLTNGFFCVYGSYATNTHDDSSDIDLLYIHRENKNIAKRTNEIYNDIGISFYELSIRDLMDDANGKYGGFFCGKIFNPHLIIDNTRNDYIIIQKCIANFFSNLFNENYCILGKGYTDDEILKTAINIYIDLYPEYFAYIMRLMNSVGFEEIWNNWKQVYINFLIEEKVIKRINNKNYYLNVLNKDRYFRKKIDYISRFWIFGAISHNSDINFYDYYKEKNYYYIKSNIDLKNKTEKFLDFTYYIERENFNEIL